MSAAAPALVDPAWLAPRLGDPALCVLDVSVETTPPARQGEPWGARPAREAWQERHVPGAGFADLVAELSDPRSPLPYTARSPEETAAAFARHGVSETTHVVLYDGQGGQFAARAWWLLRWIGHDRASVLDGGFGRWLAEGRPVSREQPERLAGSLQARPRPGLLVGLEEVRAALETGSATLVNALPRRAWDGSTTSSFARVGQIPGSVELAGEAVVDPVTGRVRPPGEIRRLAEPLGLDDDRPLILYCGGGITAAKVALALHVAGRERGVAVYDGSLSEWTADPSLPLDVS